ncbi:hypothetical protein GGI03_003736 [Coemansia sp. RSA 2337]|nr:hypothetical protein GGI03_003736 [Coemansia sp. RSA 2337]
MNGNSDILYHELFGEASDDDLEFLDDFEEPIPGLVVYRSVQSIEQCSQYFSWLTSEYFSNTNKKVNQGMHFGALTDPNTPLGRLSQICTTLSGLLPASVLSRSVLFDQAIINLYDRGEGIGDHVDLLRFEDGVVGFSFGGSAIMRMRRVDDMQSAATYAKELESEDPEEVTVRLDAGDVYAMSGEARAARQILTRMKSVGYSTADWKKHTLTPSIANSQAIEWIFLVDALNFSFWSDQPRQYSVTLDGKTYHGYWTLCAAVNRALAAGIPITDAAYYAKASDEELADVFRGDSVESIPLLGERIGVLREVGRVLVDKYQGRFSNLLACCEGSAQRLVNLVVTEFMCFRDEHQFHGRPVAMYKRAQILVADIWACFEGKGLGRFVDIDSITMFADYRVPQALCHFGALEYSPRLLEFLRESEKVVRQVGELNAQQCPPTPGLLPPGHPWEIEIRGNSIWAVECIKRCIEESGTPVNAILLDFYLWDYSKEYAKEMQEIPIHLTRSINY